MVWGLLGAGLVLVLLRADLIGAQHRLEKQWRRANGKRSLAVNVLGVAFVVLLVILLAGRR